MKKAITVVIIVVLIALAVAAIYLIDLASSPRYDMDYDTCSSDSEMIVGEQEGSIKNLPTYKDITVNVSFRNSADFPAANESVQSLINEYFTLYYSSLGSYDAADLSHLYYFDTDYERSLISTMIDYQIRIRKNMHIDLTYDECNVGVTFRGIEETKKGIKISLYENNYLNYAFAGDITSYTSGVEHDFIIKEAAGTYYIVSHNEITGVYSLITERFDEMLRREKLTLSTLTKNQLVKLFNELNDSLIISADQGFEELYYQRAKYNFDPESFLPEKTADNPYNFDAALAYSYQWAGKYDILRNPSFLAYDEHGGNCNNFTSQCIYAAGVPMDLSGDIYHQWKWYGDDISGYSTAYGRTMSWTGVEFFWQYCNENTGRGLVAECGGNIYSGRPGDILQYVDNNVGVHSVIISKVIYDEKGNVLDYLINSNTTDKVDCPMSTYGYTDFRLIRIIGWNN